MQSRVVLPPPRAARFVGRAAGSVPCGPSLGGVSSAGSAAVVSKSNAPVSTKIYQISNCGHIVAQKFTISPCAMHCWCVSSLRQTACIICLQGSMRCCPCDASLKSSRPCVRSCHDPLYTRPYILLSSGICQGWPALLLYPCIRHTSNLNSNRLCQSKFSNPVFIPSTIIVCTSCATLVDSYAFHLKPHVLSRY